MNKNFYKIILIFLFVTFAFFNGCSEDATQSLWPPPPSGDPPVVNSIEPANNAIAGVSVVTINGSNFSADTSQIIVFFNEEPGKIIEATPAQLRVRVPNLVSDAVAVRVSRIGSEKFSNTMQYQLTPAYAEIKRDVGGGELFTENLVPYGVTTDALGNIYTSVVEFSVGQGIKKISPSGIIIPNGLLEDFAPKGGETSFHRLNMWQNLTIVGARRVAAIFEITEGVAAAVFVSQGLGDANDIDFDQNLNIWVGGEGLFRVTPSKEIKSFQYPNDIKSIRIFNNYLYILTTINNDDAIWRFPIISSDSLGSAEEFFNISQTVEQNLGTDRVIGTDFEIAADGDIVVGTTRGVDPIIVIHQDGSFNSLYPGVIPNNTRVFAFAWGPEQYLYFTRQADLTREIIQSIFRLDMQKQSAPHYGR